MQGFCYLSAVGGHLVASTSGQCGPHQFEHPFISLGCTPGGGIAGSPDFRPHSVPAYPAASLRPPRARPGEQDSLLPTLYQPAEHPPQNMDQSPEATVRGDSGDRGPCVRSLTRAAGARCLLVPVSCRCPAPISACDFPFQQM